jgi:hypothetical protein
VGVLSLRLGYSRSVAPSHLLALALCAGCSLKHDFSDTQFRCDESDRCPSGYTCAGGVCRGPDDLIDAAPTDPALMSWATTSSLPGVRDYNFTHMPFVRDTLYFIGGYGTAEVASVFYARPDASGQLSAWATTSPLPAPRALGDIVTFEDRIYAVGGADASVARTQVYIGTPNATGDVLGWATTASLPVPIKAHAAATANRFVYALGGGDATNTRQNAVYVAPILGDGTLGAWQPTTPLPAPRANLSAVTANGYLYALGGDDNASAPYNDVWFAPLDPDKGSVGPWTATTMLPAPLRSLVAVADNEYVYVLGGSMATTETGQVLHSRFNADGTLGPWEFNLALPGPRARHAGALVGNRIYIAAGSASPRSVVFGTRVAP